MSPADGQQEPSMEEILASIRRIISEDGDGDQAPAPQAVPEPVEDEIEERDALEPDPEPEPDVVLEAMDEEPDDEVLELTDLVDDDGTVVDLAQPAAREPAPMAELLPEDAGMPAAGDDDGNILSDHAAAMAAGSLAALTTAAGRKIADQLGASDIGGLTVEELVRQLLRPMLRDWLDQNLPPMVERLVRREIERLAQQVRR
ncbi:MAG: DUF2497 domain-containing protein [Alphaproteobacteria bacterium]